MGAGSFSVVSTTTNDEFRGGHYVVAVFEVSVLGKRLAGTQLFEVALL